MPALLLELILKPLQRTIDGALDALQDAMRIFSGHINKALREWLYLNSGGKVTFRGADGGIEELHQWEMQVLEGSREVHIAPGLLFEATRN